MNKPYDTLSFSFYDLPIILVFYNPIRNKSRHTGIVTKWTICSEDKPTVKSFIFFGLLGIEFYNITGYLGSSKETINIIGWTLNKFIFGD